MSSQSYLNAVEELEVLRRLTEKQEKDLEYYREQLRHQTGRTQRSQVAVKRQQGETQTGKKGKTWNKIVGGI